MNYRRENRTGGNSGKKYARKGPGERRFGARDSAKPTMHKTICSECDKECEVPFKPSGNKPVFCRNCFKNKGDANPRDFGERSFEERNSRSKNAGTITNEQFEILNSKLNKILDALDSARHIR